MATSRRGSTRPALLKELLTIVDVFVEERIRQAERDLGNLLERREKEAQEEGRHRVLSSLAELADLVDGLRSHMTSAAGALAGKALDKRMDRIFKSYGFTRIATVGRPFDSRVHEAVEEREEEGVPHDTIVEEISRGYERDGFVLRVARVVVAA